MDELFKVAENGQWSLEKSYDKAGDEKAKALIAEFLARKQQSNGAAPAPRPSTPPAPTTSMPPNMRPAQVSTMNHADAQIPDKERVAAIRAMIDAKAKESKAPTGPTGEMAEHWKRVKERQNAIKAKADRIHAVKPSSGQPPETLAERNREARKELPLAKPERQKAWQSTVDFLAEKDPDGGWKGLKETMAQRKALDAAHATGELPQEAKPELLPPQAPFEETHPETGEISRGMRTRQGTFNGEGATTTGKIVNTRVGYKDAATGEMKGRVIPQQETHHWAWNADPSHPQKGEWKHLRTTHDKPKS